MANVVPDRLRFSFTGHDDLDAIRDEGIWNKTLNAVAETGGSATLEMVKALATGFLKKTLELHIGVSMSAQNGPCRAPQRGLADTLRQRSLPPKLQSHTSGN